MTQGSTITTHQRDSDATTGPRKAARPGGNHAATNATGVPGWLQSRADEHDAAASVAADPAQVTGGAGAGRAAGDIMEQSIPRPPQGDGVRAKLEVGGVNDPEEHEADSMASA